MAEDTDPITLTEEQVKADTTIETSFPTTEAVGNDVAWADSSLTKDENSPSPPNGGEEAGDSGGHLNVWLEALGITTDGTCIRHKNCPVWVASSKMFVPCRICFSEEKAAGIRQRQTFAAVVQQLSKSNSSQKTLSEESKDETVNPILPDFAVADILRQPKALESMMKRLGQVQNWQLRQKEKEVHSLQMQIHKLEQRLSDCEQTNQEQKQTIRALRRTIQQDLKVIKTMATQKQMELEAEAEFEAAYNAKIQDGALAGMMSPYGTKALSVGSVSDDDDTPNASPLKVPQIYRSPPKRNVSPFPVAGRGPGSDSSSPQKDPRLQAQMQVFQRATRARGDIPVPARRNRSFEGMIPEESPVQSGGDSSSEQRSGASSYWNDADMALATNPSKLFASFRGGLLDIPKSPPPPAHDNRRERKLQLDANDMSALRMPTRGVLSRHNSADPTDFPPMVEPPPLRKGRKKTKASITDDTEKREIPADLLAEPLSSLPMTKVADQPSTSLPMPPLSSNESGGLAHHLSKTNAKMPQRLPSQRPGQSMGLSPSKTNAARPLRDLASTPQAFKLSTMSVATAETGLTFADGATVALGLDTDVVDVEEEPASLLERKLASDSQVRVQRASSAGEDTLLTELTGPTFFDEKTPEATNKVESSSSEKFLFTITNAPCCDKYGDTGEYTGTILVTEGLPHGKGTMKYESGRVYGGDWVSGQWNGKGKLLNPNGDTYEGEFVLDARHGKGVYKWDNGDIYTGMFREDKRHGQGKFSFHNGNIYEGEFCDGMFDGYGKYKFEGGYYEGEWKEGKYHGNGELVYASGGKYTGEFRNSVAHGFGMEVTADGKKRRGVWENGQPVE